MKKLITSLALLLGLAAAAPAAMAQEQTQGEGIRFHDNQSWDSVVELASKENKLIFMDCYTSWCGPCKGLARDIFPKKEMGDYFNPNFICVKYDMEKGDGKMLYDRYKDHILGFPTMLFIDKNGKIVQQLAGYQEADVIISSAQKAAEGKDLFTLKKKYEAGERATEFLTDYIESLNAAFMKDDAKKVAEEYIATMDPAQLDDDAIWATFGPYVNDVNTPAFEYIVNNTTKFQHRLHRDRYKLNSQIGYACRAVLRNDLNINLDKEGNPQPLNADTGLAEKAIRYLAKADIAGTENARAQLYVYKLLLAGDYDGAWQTVKTCRNIGLTNFYPMAVNEYVMYMLPQTKDKKVLKDYQQVLNQAVNSEKGSDFTYRLYGTLSKISDKLGDKKEAARLDGIYQEKAAESEAKFRAMFGSLADGDDKAKDSEKK